MSRRRPMTSREKHASLARLRAWTLAHPEQARTTSRRRAERRRKDPTKLEARRNEYRLRNKRRKLKVIQAYGGKCACCGENQYEFLTVDHIDGGGIAHRKSLGRKGVGNHFYLWLARQGFPSGYRVLCFNCNGAIGCYGYCPHGGIPDQPIRNRGPLTELSL